MKIAQLRQTLEAMAKVYQSGGKLEDAEVLRKLCRALSPADKDQVSKALERLRS
jgi:energy-converting hydrogenase A subunit M